LDDSPAYWRLSGSRELPALEWLAIWRLRAFRWLARWRHPNTFWGLSAFGWATALRLAPLRAAAA
jgi:hypothetical protein